MRETTLLLFGACGTMKHYHTYTCNSVLRIPNALTNDTTYYLGISGPITAALFSSSPRTLVLSLCENIRNAHPVQIPDTVHGQALHLGQRVKEPFIPHEGVACQVAARK